MKRIETDRSAIGAVLVTVLLTLPFVARGGIAPSAQGAKHFLDLCTSCHTIGGGDLAGPDLIAATRWPRENLRKAVKGMEENAGPLKPDQIEALVDLLMDPDVKVRLAAASAPAIEMSPERKAASAGTGRRLFFGEMPLANRGSPCFACHSVAGRGGNLAVDRGVPAACRVEPPIPLPGRNFHRCGEVLSDLVPGALHPLLYGAFEPGIRTGATRRAVIAAAARPGTARAMRRATGMASSPRRPGRASAAEARPPAAAA